MLKNVILIQNIYEVKMLVYNFKRESAGVCFGFPRKMILS